MTDPLDVAHHFMHEAFDALASFSGCAEECIVYRDAALYAEWAFLSEVDFWLREQTEGA